MLVRRKFLYPNKNIPVSCPIVSRRTASVSIVIIPSTRPGAPSKTFRTTAEPSARLAGPKPALARELRVKTVRIRPLVAQSLAHTHLSLGGAAGVLVLGPASVPPARVLVLGGSQPRVYGEARLGRVVISVSPAAVSSVVVAVAPATVASVASAAAAAAVEAGGDA